MPKCSRISPLSFKVGVTNRQGVDMQALQQLLKWSGLGAKLPVIGHSGRCSV